MSIKDLLNYLDEQLEKHRTLVCTSCTGLGRWLHRSGIAGPRFMLSGCVFFLTSAGYYFFYKKQYNVAVFLCFMALSMLIMALTMDRGDNIEFIALAFACPRCYRRYRISDNHALKVAPSCDTLAPHIFLVMALRLHSLQH